MPWPLEACFQCWFQLKTKSALACSFCTASKPPVPQRSHWAERHFKYLNSCPWYRRHRLNYGKGCLQNLRSHFQNFEYFATFAIFHSSSIFNENELNEDCLKKRCNSFLICPVCIIIFFLSWRAVILACLFKNTYYCFSERKAKSRLAFPSSWGPSENPVPADKPAVDPQIWDKLRSATA